MEDIEKEIRKLATVDPNLYIKLIKPKIVDDCIDAYEAYKECRKNKSRDECIAELELILDDLGLTIEECMLEEDLF